MKEYRHRVSAYLPGTSAYRKRRYARIAAAESSLRRKFCFIENCLAQTDREVFGRHLRRAAMANIRFESLINITKWVLIAAGLTALYAVGGVLIITIPIPPEVPPGTWTEAQMQRGIAFTIALVMTAMLQLLAQRQSRVSDLQVNVLRLWVLITVVLGAFGVASLTVDAFSSGYSSLHLDLDELRGTLLGFIAAAILLFALLLTVYVLVGVSLLLRRIWGRSSPESRLTFFTAMAMHAIRGRRWRDLKCRREAVECLERTAYTFENYVPSVLRPSCTGTREWLRQRSREMAAKPRDLQRWLVSPRADTQPHVEAELFSLLLRILRHDWSAIEAPIPQAISTGLSIRRAAHTVAVAVLPAVGVCIFSRLGIFEEAGVSWIGVGSYLWAVIVVLFALDPLLAERVAAIRDIKHILST